MKHLFTPNYIGNVEVKNRIVMPAMHLNYTPEGEINSKVIEFYKERAKGGVGLIIVGGCKIDDVGSGPMMIDVSDRRFLEGLKQLTGAIHNEGAKIAAQLYQAGRYTHSAFSGKQPVAPSPIASRLTREEPRELTVEEIKELVETFANSALIVKEAGFDAVEIIGSAGYIISQFLSPITNKREDEYGGALANRMKFGLEVVSRVRESVGPDFPIIVRVGGNDFMPGGNTNVEIREFCRNLDQIGIDCLNVTGGWHETRVPQLTMCVPPGTYVYLAENIKKEVSVPVIACNRINDPELAENIIAEGRADFVGVARGMIADSEFPLKAKEGRPEKVRKCLGCNQGCLDNVFSLQEVTCLVNPRAGKEKETPILPADKPKNILVIGGGVAGMEASRVAALRGHNVSLWEQEEKLGGQIHLAAAPPGRADFLHLYNYLEQEINELGVDIHLNCRATLPKVEEENFDAVIVATGAKQIKPDIPGIDNSNVVMAWDVLKRKSFVKDNVVVLGGGAIGVEVAMFIAEQGTISGESLKFLFARQAENADVLFELITKGQKTITVVEMLKKIGKDIGISTRWTMIDDLRRSNVKTLKNTTAKEITSQGVIAENEEGEDNLIPADTVVVAVGSTAENALYNELKEALNKETYVIGDAANPQKALEAMQEAFELAVQL